MAFQYPQSPPSLSSTLNEHYGAEIELVTDEGTVQSFVIKQEFVWGNVAYAVLLPFGSTDDEELEFMRIFADQGEIELESIVDEEEWEAVAEAYDDLQFATDERP